MGICKGIFQGSSPDCESPLKASVSERLLIGNLEDIEQVLYSVTNPSVIEDIIMKAGTSMYAFEGIKSSNIPQMDLIPDAIPSYNHQIDFSVFTVGSDDKVNLQNMAVKKTFGIYQNPKDSSLEDSIWEVLGIGAGMEMSVLQRLPASKDGSFKIQLKTPETVSETSLPASFWDTDIPVTEAKILALFSGGNLVLTSGTVEPGAPSDIVLTFEDALGAPANITNFGGIVLSGDLPLHALVSVAILANVVTITANPVYILAETIEISGNFESAGGKLNLKNQIITNNIV